MQYSNADLWHTYVAKNTDGYGAGIIAYAQRWAELMETRIAAGEDLMQCAEPTSHEADTNGITGFMYGAAVATLAGCWVYGEQLRRWHNLETQIGTEGEQANQHGGVLNPAVLHIRDPEA